MTSEPNGGSALRTKITNKTAQITVIGAGYVGLPLAAELCAAGFRVTALDSDSERVRKLSAGHSYVPDVPSERLGPHVTEGRLRASSDPRVLAETDVAIVCVQTPLDHNRDPDIRHIVAAVDEIARHQHEGMLVVLESTTYPGTTREVLVPKLGARSELGREVFVAYSPQRTDPRNPTYGTRNTPRVIAGATPACLEMASLLYGQIVDTLVPVTSPDTAELVKLFENTFRAVNIALANELALMSERLGVDPFEVIDAAATKPFGFMPFYPGPGTGGHCIALDPLYLAWKLRDHSYHARFIELADAVNRAMPEHVVERVAAALNDRSRSLRGSRVLVYGVAYKPDVADTRESPALPILRMLAERGADIAYLDPYVPELEAEGLSLRSVEQTARFTEFDAVVIVTDHGALDRARLVAEAKLVVDTRGALRPRSEPRAKPSR
ncbi:MAG TPA: nucleotide sugar dehydrogenase [Polyangiaceae bacterium]